MAYVAGNNKFFVYIPTVKYSCLLVLLSIGGFQLFSVDLSAQSRIGLGITIDYGNRIPAPTVNEQVIWNNRLLDLETQSVIPSITYSYFFTENVAVLLEGQFGFRHRYTRYFYGFILQTFQHEERFLRGSLAVRYYPKPFWFVGAGPAVEVMTYQLQRELNRVGPVAVADSPLHRRVAAYLHTGIFYKGFEAQLSYYFSPGYKSRTADYNLYQANLTRNLLVPLLRYTVALSKKKKRRH